jgi:hypothetical protein
MVDLGFVAVAVLGVLGSIGGVPQLLNLIKPKPHLVINQASITKLPNDNYKYQIRLEVQNVTKLFSRTTDASNVVAEYYMMDKNGVQWGTLTNQTVTPYLVAGTKAVKNIEAYHSFMPEGNPYQIVFRVTCNEKAVAKQKSATKPRHGTPTTLSPTFIREGNPEASCGICCIQNVMSAGGAKRLVL